MKARVSVSTRIVVAAAVLLAAAAAWGASPAKIRIGKQPASRPGTFSMSTTYSGYISETLRVGGVEYQISPSATIYVVGEGVVEPGFAVNNVYVYVSGRRIGSEAMVTSIVVRRRGSPGSEKRLEKGNVGVLPAGSPS